MSKIEVSNLNFEYPGKLALQNASFSIEAQSITALVGPNGAGKTTLMNCMAALARPISGKVLVDGIDIMKDPRKYHIKLGYLPDFFGLYDELTVRQCLKYLGRAHHIKDEDIPLCLERTAELVQIEEYLDKKVKHLSRGLRQRVAIGQTLIHDPEILLLDEPSAGLDPEARYHFSNLLLKLCRDGKTIVVSSHILSELEDYATHLLVLRDGKVLAHSKISHIKMSDKRKLVLTLAEPVEELISQLEGFELVEEVEGEGLRFQFSFCGDSHAQHLLLKSFLDNGIPACGLSELVTDLQEVYVKKYSGQSN